MAATVRAYKGLVTERIETIIDWMRDNDALLITSPETARRRRAHDVSMALKVCDEHIALLETSLGKLASAFDDLEEHSEDDEEQLESNYEASRS